MKYIKTYEFFKPIKINNEKPFKIKKNIDRSMKYLQTGISSLKNRIYKEKDIKKRADMNKLLNQKIKELKDLQFKKVKQTAYLKENPIEESVENNDVNLITILKDIVSEKLEPFEIEKYMGFDEDEYEFSHQYNSIIYDKLVDNNGMTFQTNFSEIEDIKGLEEGVITWILNLTNYYSGYEYYVDESEMNYLDRYLKKDLLHKIEKLAKKFKYKINVDREGDIRNFFEYLGLNDDLKDFENEISMENERAVEKAANATIKSLPFELEEKYNDKNFNCEISINYDTIINYMEKNNLEVSSIKEFIENVSELDDFSYEIEYNHYEYLENFDDLKRSVENVVNKYLEQPDEVFPNIIKYDKLKTFKKNINLALFSYNYDIWLKGDRELANLFKIAKFYDNNIYKWLLTDDFEEILKKIGDERDMENYMDFRVGENMRKFNI